MSRKVNVQYPPYRSLYVNSTPRIPQTLLSSHFFYTFLFNVFLRPSFFLPWVFIFIFLQFQFNLSTGAIHLAVCGGGGGGGVEGVTRRWRGGEYLPCSMHRIKTFPFTRRQNSKHSSTE